MPNYPQSLCFASPATLSPGTAASKSRRHCRSSREVWIRCSCSIISSSCALRSEISASCAVLVSIRVLYPLSSPSFYRRPEQASAEHKEVLRRLGEKADEAGFVALRDAL